MIRVEFNREIEEEFSKLNGWAIFGKLKTRLG